MIDFKSIETFLWVVTLGSFGGAARKLNTTQPAISQRIAQLESEIGVKLLQRDSRTVMPTPSGRQMMQYAEKLIALRSEMLAAVMDRSAMRGILRLASPRQSFTPGCRNSSNASQAHILICRSKSKSTSRPIFARGCWRRRSISPFVSGLCRFRTCAIACYAIIRFRLLPALRSVSATVC